MNKNLKKCWAGNRVNCVSDEEAYNWVQHNEAFDESDLALIDRAINLSRGIIFSTIRESASCSTIAEAICKGDVGRDDFELVIPGCRDTQEAFMPFFRVRLEGETFFYFIKLYKENDACAESLRAEVIDATDLRLVSLLDN
jgi:hypothetical protein